MGAQILAFAGIFLISAFVIQGRPSGPRGPYRKYVLFIYLKESYFRRPGISFQASGLNNTYNIRISTKV